MTTITSLSRRQFLQGCGAFSLLGLAHLAGCAPPRQPLKLSAQAWPGYEFLFLARESGWLPPELIRLVEVTNGTDSIQLLKEGLVDGAALTLDEVLRCRADGQAISVIALCDFSQGADVVLARPGITEPHALKGKRVGVEESAVGGLMLAKLLQAAHLDVRDITLVHAGIEEHMRLWQGGGLDALVTYGAVARRLERQGARLLLDTRSFPDSVVDVLAVNQRARDEHAPALHVLLQGYFRAQSQFVAHPQDHAAFLARRLGVAEAGVAAEFAGLRLVDVAENRRLLTGRADALRHTAEELLQVMREHRLLSGEDGLEGLFNAAYLPASAEGV